MFRVRSVSVLTVIAVFASALVAAAQTQAPQRSQRGPRLGMSSLLGLLRIEQVQKEMNLSQEQTDKVKALVEKIGAEMREQFAALRGMEDREKRLEKMTELSETLDQKTREELRDVLEREQVMRLYQIRMQVRAVVDSLANRYVAGRLQLTEEQKEKVAKIAKGAQAKQFELFSAMRDASQEQRTEVYQKFRKIRSDADEQALALLTAEQKAAFEKMKGKKIELQIRRGPR